MIHGRNRTRHCGITLIIGSCALLLITACASDQPKPPPQPTPDQVRSHADRGFEKLKQEEQEQATQPTAPRQ
jgi:outer membrane biogenesis lipoprotein LolB